MFPGCIFIKSSILFQFAKLLANIFPLFSFFLKKVSAMSLIILIFFCSEYSLGYFFLLYYDKSIQIQF